MPEPNLEAKVVIAFCTGPVDVENIRISSFDFERYHQDSTKTRFIT